MADVLYDPQKAREYTKKAMEEASRGKFLEAIACYEIALAHDPKNVFIYILRGFFYSDDMGDASRAAADFTKALELDPNSAEAEYGLGLAYYKLEKNKESLPHYTRAVELKPDYQNAWVNRGALLCKLKRFGVAVADLKKGIELDEGDTIAWWHLGLAHEGLGDLKSAIKTFEQLEELTPGDEDVEKKLAKWRKQSAEQIEDTRCPYAWGLWLAGVLTHAVE